MNQLGDLFSALRRKRGLSQKKLAARAQVTARTLQYWEANQQQPRDVELENMLTALQVTAQERGQIYALLQDNRSVRLTRSAPSLADVPTTLLGPMPGLGDLVRAMRLRRSWTQEKFAEEMQVSRSTVIRWEATRTLPADEDMERLSLMLHASPEERAALLARRLTLPQWTPQLTLDECYEQCDALWQVRSGKAPLTPLTELQMLALKRQLRLRLGQSSEALRLLAKTEVMHSWLLYMQGRSAESCAGNWRVLNLVRGRLSPEAYWANALNLLSSHAAQGIGGPENGVRFLHPWLSLLPPSLQIWILLDMAYYAGKAQLAEEACLFLKQAERLVTGPLKQSKGEQELWRSFRFVKARVLLNIGNPMDALNWLPPLSPVGDGGIHELTVWAETYLAAGEKGMASRYLSQANALLEKMPLPVRQSKLERMAQQI